MLAALLGLLLQTMGTAAQATQALRVETHYVEPGPGTAHTSGIDELAAVRGRADWAPFTGVLSLGYLAEPYWIRVRVHLNAPQGVLVLRMRPAFLDDVRVFMPRADGSVRIEAIGDRQVEDEQRLHDTALTVDLNPETGASVQEVFIRVQTTSARMAGIQVMGLVAAEQARLRENTLLGLYFGIMFCLLGWASSRAVLDRDPVFGWYSAYQAASLCMNFGLMGYARLYLPAGWSADVWTTTFVLSISLLAPGFHRVLLTSVMAPSPLPSSIRWVLLGAIGLGALNLLQIALGRVGPALAINANLVSLLSIALAVLVVVQARREPHSPLRRLLMGYVALCVVTLMTLLPLLGVVQGGAWTLFSTSVHGLLAALLLAGMLMVRGADMKRQAEENRRQIVQEQARTRQAQSERDEKDRFLSMLTHELRTPLSVIRMVIDGVRRSEESASSRRRLDLARSAVVDIDQVIEATVQVDRLERRVLETRRVGCDLQEMVNLCVDSIDESDARRIAFTPPQVGVQVVSDPVLLRSIIANLLDNALKYSPAQSAVELQVLQRARGAVEIPVLRVCNLPGRAGRPDPRLVFNKYWRSHGAKHSTGSGQGLYLVQGLATHLGLEVRCEPGSDADPASRVCFELCWAGGMNAADDSDRGGP